MRLRFLLPQILVFIATIVYAEPSDSIPAKETDTLKSQLKESIPTGDVIDEIVWVVGDEAILRSDIEKQIVQSKYEKIDITGDPYCIVSEQIAVRKLFLHQAVLDSIEASESNVNMQVDARMNEVIAQVGSEEKVAEYYGKPIKALKEELKEQAREQMKVQQVQRNLVAEKKITPSEVRKYFEKNQSTELPIVPTKVEIEILAIQPVIKREQTEELKEKLRQYKKRIEDGDASFSMLATLYSDDVASARNGGTLGFMGKGQLVAPFANELFSMSHAGQISKVVETEYGLHIIEFLERRGDKINCRHILLKPKVSLEDRQKTNTKVDSIANLIREGKIKMGDAVAMYSTDKDTRNNGGLMENMRDGSSWFEYQALPSDISRVAYNMNVGEISRPFFYEDSKGHEVCAIIRLKSKIEQHRANMQQDYSLMKKIVSEASNQKTLEEWIAQKQAETYTRISPDLKGCTWTYPGWHNSK